MIHKALVVGGASGIGLAIAKRLAARPECERVYIVDKNALAEQHREPKIESLVFDLCSADYSLFDRFGDIDCLMLTAGFGRQALFEQVDDAHIRASFDVNTVATLRVIRHFYGLIHGTRDFHTGVMVSIAGFLTSPFFSIYAATKAALRIFIESVNAELTKAGTTNRILNVSPGRIDGTSFYKGATDLDRLTPLADDIIAHLEAKDDLFIPQWEEVYSKVLDRYHADFRAEGLHSYEYKAARLNAQQK